MNTAAAATAEKIANLFVSVRVQLGDDQLDAQVLSVRLKKISDLDVFLEQATAQADELVAAIAAKRMPEVYRERVTATMELAQEHLASLGYGA